MQTEQDASLSRDARDLRDHGSEPGGRVSGLEREGYCVFATNHGNRGLRSIGDPGRDLGRFVKNVIGVYGGEEGRVVATHQNIYDDPIARESMSAALDNPDQTRAGAA